MNQIALVIPYFGKLPNYFALWLKTAGYNSGIDYILFTDENLQNFAIPENVKCFHMTFDEVRKRVANILNFNFVLHSPYKLCDYKPLYGIIFTDYLKEYTFWGHCDPDVIWGNLSEYITEDILKNYDRIYQRGHLCIYRNTNFINTAAIQKLETSSVYYKDVYSHRYIAHYDEGTLLRSLIEKQGGRQWNEDDFADISYFHKQFILVKQEKLCEAVAAFHWKDGEITGLGIDGDLDKAHKYSYVHLQKRKMNFQTERLGDDFLITPDGFIPYTPDWKNFAAKWLQDDPKFEKQAIKNNRKNQIKNVREGALIFRWKHLLEKEI